MMGQLGSEQDKLFYSFNLDNHVPREHLLRGIDHFLDLSDLRQHLAPFYSPMGRPSIDPELMIRMLIVGYCFGIRSERRLCEEVHLNLAYRWFCRLGLEDTVPEHSTFSKNRHGRFRDSDVLRHVFESVVGRCMSEGLVKGEGFAIDASIIRADASSVRAVPGSDPIDGLRQRPKPCSAGVSGSIGKSQFGKHRSGREGRDIDASKEAISDGSRRELDSREGWLAVLRLLDQLSD
ncbi:transposase [Robbsia andropogonis]